MAITVINREEQKYFLSIKQYNELINLLKEELVEDLYFKETIYNVYFDNDAFELINRSIDKPLYKEKIRLRSYENAKDDTKVFLEIKKKFLNNSNKRRVIIAYKDYLNYLEKGIMPSGCDKQIMKEIDYCFNKYKLKPKIKVRYDRIAYYLKGDENFRITFDTNIRYDFNNLDFSNFKDDNLFIKNNYIMEIKTYKGLPIWLNEIFLKLKIYPTSFSKVGKIYESIKESI